jgi:hypothetical protein
MDAGGLFFESREQSLGGGGEEIADWGLRIAD